ncbi:MAG: hypothetical protein H6940_02725 [Burkholderiales bacterium]|nr:hypothetical protein [Burkholderiales bacterium]
MVGRFNVAGSVRFRVGRNVYNSWFATYPITVKRRQSPPGIRVTQCDFGATWRHLVTNGFEELIACETSKMYEENWV